MLFIFDDMIANVLSNKKPIVTELFISITSSTKTKTSLVSITQFYLLYSTKK